MNLSQLRFVREAVRQDFNLTDVANTLFISQPGVSKQIKDLEDELGVEIFERRGKRLTGLTEPGKQIVPVIERVLLDIRNLKKIADQFANQDHGHLTVATTHTQARYALPRVVTAFRALYPKVHLALHQSSPQQIAQMVATGEADIGISTEALDKHAELRTFPAYTWRHCVLVQKGHPLEQVQPLTLQALAEYPIVTYDAAFAGRSHIDAAFSGAKLTPDIVLTAIDADVIKTYVEAGLGVGIVTDMAYDEARDTHLTRLDTSHLFEPNVSKVAVRRGAYLREFAIQFVSLVARDLSPELIRTALSRQEDSDTYGRGSE